MRIRAIACTTAAATLLALAGCVGTGKAAPAITSFDLDYPPPSFPEMARQDRVVTVQLTAATQSLAGTDMLYQTAPFSRNSYNYGRWVSPPADLVTTWLVRDLAHSGLVTAAFAATGGLDSRYLLEGTVEQFLEIDQGSAARARIELSAALVDLRSPNGDRAILFQKDYDREAPMGAQNGEALARGMSAAVAEVSRAIITDLYQALAAYTP